MRKCFTKTERETYTPGTVVEWLNGSHWQPGTVVDTPKMDYTGWESVHIASGVTTRTISKGQRVDATPNHVRLPKS